MASKSKSKCPKSCLANPSLTQKQRDFCALLKSDKPFMLDGAMGTALYQLGCFINRSFDEANLTAPQKVAAVHEAHINAGAEVIETNTFSANRCLLSKYGAADQTAEINRAGVRLARKAVDDSRREVYVAGSVGPTGEAIGYMSDSTCELIEQAFEEQVSLLTEEGVDLLLLETFRHLHEVKIALKVARKHFFGVIVAQMSFEDGLLQDGTPPERVAELLVSWGANSVGVNCDGPARVYETAVKMVKSSRVPVVACPNAGQPRVLDSRMLYMATPEYFSVYGRRMLKAGVRGVGGCCGTTSEHLEMLAGSVRMLAAGLIEDDTPPSPKSDGEGSHRGGCVGSLLANLKTCQNTAEPVPQKEKSLFAAKVARVWEERLKKGTQRKAPVGKEDFVVSVEVNPAPGLDISKRVEAARKLKEAGVDVINIADGPRAAVRVSNTSLGLALQKELGTEVILHVCCRDRNLLGLQSDILGYHVMGLHNLVIITGDPPKMGDYPKATAVFDLDSISLLHLVNGLNRGVDPAGKVSSGQTNFFCATGAEPGAVDYKRELKRLKQKIDAGAELIMTQPVYSIEVAERFLDDVEPLGVPVLLGLCPLVSSRNAEFLHNEVPGMQIPENIRKRMKDVGRGPAAIEEGVKIAKEMLDALQDRVVGCYIMPQLGKFSAALDILSDLDILEQKRPQRQMGV
eukprot:CAMPEP_0201489498 /NCGR_PEP_ID=MMETSP0151_2-20130828/22842_1 /ASSEMBLY_ACC=CAM_ASM_000257 /TAXON_ID=200890 /ORGANISM="Paramoeba atlantica, Strain 621/1 / CCAP 1560/9" /LENGTH=685 /DNA_ID=CAMNT_0047875113 /DNA_START=63 /DNA_END=2121 /DNA_ORIENTATION=-